MRKILIFGVAGFWSAVMISAFHGNATADDSGARQLPRTATIQKAHIEQAARNGTWNFTLAEVVRGATWRMSVAAAHRAAIGEDTRHLQIARSE